MANLTPQAKWDDVFQVETGTPATGGPGGAANNQAQALLNRTELLKRVAIPYDLKADAVADAESGALADGMQVDTLDAQERYKVQGGNLVFVGYIFDGPVYVKRFGATSLGDSTEAFRAAHAFANTIGATVSYAGLSEIILQAGAQIKVHTSVDWCGIPINLLGGVQVPLEYAGGFFEAYHVEDPATPYETVAGSFTAANLYAGSDIPTKGVFDGRGYALLTCTGITVPNRDETSTQAYTQSFYVVRNGISTESLSLSLQGAAGTCSLKVRRASARRIRLDGINLTEGAWNKQCLLKIMRNNVDLGKVTMRYQTQAGTPNISQLFYIDNAADITLEGIDGSGLAYSGISGTYVLNIGGGASITLNNIIGLDGWGWIGTNNVNGLTVNDCEVNRIDGHSSLHNVRVKGGVLGEIGVTYGWGGGIISVKGSEVRGRGAITSRNDYGATFFGRLSVEDISFYPSGIGTPSVVNLYDQPVGASTATFLPEVISLNNIRICDGGTGITTVHLVNILKRFGTANIYAPDRVSIRGVQVEGAMVARVNIPYGDLRRSFLVNQLAISGVECQSDMQINVPAATNAPTNPSILDMDVDGVSVLQATIGIEARRILVSSVHDLRRMEAAGSPLCQISKSTLRNFSTSTRVGGPRGSGTEKWTGIYDCIVNGAFDLSEVSVLQGVTIVGSTEPTLPAGVTRRIAFTGYNSIIPA